MPRLGNFLRHRLIPAVSGRQLALSEGQSLSLSSHQGNGGSDTGFCWQSKTRVKQGVDFTEFDRATPIKNYACDDLVFCLRVGLNRWTSVYSHHDSYSHRIDFKLCL